VTSNPMAKKVFASVPDAVAKDLEEWSKQQGRSLSNLIAYLLENSVKNAKEQGEFVSRNLDTDDT
jgi:molybdopterin-guanine dinucleotide biosynthesis protein A